MSDPIVIGAVIEVAHPFILEEYNGLDVDGPFTTKSWRPGVRMEQTGPEDFDPFADGVGTQIVTVVSKHKPGKWPERVFYTRRWRAPNGSEFGKTKMRITTVQAFRTLIKGYRHHYQMAEPPAEPPPKRRLVEFATSDEDLPF